MRESGHSSWTYETLDTGCRAIFTHGWKCDKSVIKVKQLLPFYSRDQCLKISKVKYNLVWILWFLLYFLLPCMECKHSNNIQTFITNFSSFYPCKKVVSHPVRRAKFGRDTLWSPIGLLLGIYVSAPCEILWVWVRRGRGCKRAQYSILIQYKLLLLPIVSPNPILILFCSLWRLSPGRTALPIVFLNMSQRYAITGITFPNEHSIDVV